MVRNLLVIVVLVLVAAGAYSQKSSLSGQVKDKATGEAIPFANVIVVSDETILGGTATDFNGKYIIKNLAPGKVKVKSSAVGFQALEIEKLLLKADQMRFLDLELVTKKETGGAVKFVPYKVPLVTKENTMTTYPLTSEDIEKMPNRTVRGVAKAVEGASGNIYFVDGVRVSAESMGRRAERNPSISGDYSLSGKVLDNKSGDAIQFAVISLYSSGKVVARTISNAEGRYSIEGIRSGKFIVKVSADDFKSKTIKDYKVSADAMNNLNIQLK